MHRQRLLSVMAVYAALSVAACSGGGPSSQAGDVFEGPGYRFDVPVGMTLDRQPLSGGGDSFLLVDPVTGMQIYTFDDLTPAAGRADKDIARGVLEARITDLFALDDFEVTGGRHVIVPGAVAGYEVEGLMGTDTTTRVFASSAVRDAGHTVVVFVVYRNDADTALRPVVNAVRDSLVVTAN